jgi:hypothetical protein
MGVLWNVMHGTITIPTVPHGCPPGAYPDDCGGKVEIAYRWIAVLCIALAGYAILARRRP